MTVEVEDRPFAEEFGSPKKTVLASTIVTVGPKEDRTLLLKIEVFCLV